MNTVHLCFGLCGKAANYSTQKTAVEKYNSLYKKLASFIFDSQDFGFSFFFSGIQLEWLKQYHEEFVMFLNDVVARRQVELLGGGYYNPIFPLILPCDKVAQIEQLTTAIRRLAGKRPRGMFVPQGLWETQLVSNISSCGMEYTLINSQLVFANKYSSVQKYRPLIVEDSGKSMIIIPYNTELFPSKEESPSDFFERLKQTATEIQNPIVCCFCDEDEFFSKIGIEWFSEFFKIVQNQNDKHVTVKLTTPSKCIDSNQLYEKICIDARLPQQIAQWAFKPFIKVPVTESTTYASVKNFLTLYPEAHNIYARMLYTGMLVSQCKGDKSRKKDARNELLKAQNCENYWFLGKNGTASMDIRSSAYRHLIQAEKIVRNNKEPFDDSIVTVDYNMDCQKEYIEHFQNIDMFMSLKGGMIFELDVLKNSRNYANTIERINSFDGVDDFYQKKIFVDHIVDDEHFDLLKNGTINRYSTIFPSVLYQEQSLDRKRHEVQLKAVAPYGCFCQPVSIKKHYSFSNNGIQVQYIIKNESPLALKAKFAVEFNLALEYTDINGQSIEVIINDEHKKIDSSINSFITQGVSFVQMSDEGGVSFSIEPNETAGIFTSPLMITRPSDNISVTQYQATTCTFFWNIDIAPNYETEKTLSFKIKYIN